MAELIDLAAKADKSVVIVVTLWFTNFQESFEKFRLQKRLNRKH